ncbi:MAG: hypothetical protein ABIK65_08130 [Candidatus Eisenbacteria bacterium]
MKLRTPAGAAALLVSTALVIGTVQPAPAGPSVFVEPRATFADPSDYFEVGLRIDDGVDTISNFQVFVEFDPAVIRFDVALEGSLYTASGNQTWFYFEEIVPGSLEVFDVIFPALSFILPPGELARLRFQALADGYSGIRFGAVNLKDIGRDPVPDVSWIDGYVWVGDVPTGVDGDLIGAPLRGIDFPRPHPFRHSVRFGLRGDGAGGAVVEVYDARGRRMTTIPAEGAGGSAECIWNGTDSRGRPVPPGVYFLRWDHEGGSAVRRVVRIR